MCFKRLLQISSPGSPAFAFITEDGEAHCTYRCRTSPTPRFKRARNLIDPLGEGGYQSKQPKQPTKPYLLLRESAADAASPDQVVILWKLVYFVNLRFRYARKDSLSFFMYVPLNYVSCWGLNPETPLTMREFISRKCMKKAHFQRRKRALFGSPTETLLKPESLEKLRIHLPRIQVIKPLLAGVAA